MIYYISIVLLIMLFLVPALCFFFLKKKQDEKDLKGTKSNVSENKPIVAAAKKSKKKSVKKGLNNEPDLGNGTDELTSENDKNDNVNQPEAVEEVIVSQKYAEESSAPSKKRKNKVKHSSGDQPSLELKVNDKNENQSNTLLGRNSDERLKEDNQVLQKKLEDYEIEKVKNENSLKEIKNLIKKKETENDNLKSELKIINGKLNKLQSDFESEKEKGNQKSVENEKAMKELENMKRETIRDNEGHTDMYKLYEEKIEKLNNDIKKNQTETANLNKGLKVEMEKKDNLQKKYDEMKEVIREKLDEIQKRENDIVKLHELNVSLKNAVDNLEKSIIVKNEESVKNDLLKQNDVAQIKKIVENLENDVTNKNVEIDNLLKKEDSLNNTISTLSKSAKTLSNKCEELEMKNNHLVTLNHDLDISLQSKIDECQCLEKSIVTLRSEVSLTDEMKSKLSSEKDEYVGKCKHLEKDIIRRNEIIKELEQKLDDRCKRVSHLENNQIILDGKVISLTGGIEELSQTLSLTKTSSADEIKKLNEIIIKYEREILDEVTEIEDFKKKNTILVEKVSSLEHEIEELQRNSVVQNNISLASQEVHKDNSRLEAVINDLKKELNIKNNEIENLISEKSLLTESLKSSANLVVEELKKEVNVKEEFYNRNSEMNQYNLEELNKKVCLLTKERDDLQKEMGEREHQAANMMEKMTELLVEKKSAERESTIEIGNLNKTIEELMKEKENQNDQALIVNEEIIAENNVQLKSDCPSDLFSIDLNENEKLKFHIKKLENELIKMQGRYFLLKDDSVKTGIEEGYTTRNEISRKNVIDIPPNLVDNCSQVQEHANDIRSITHDSLQEAINRLNSEIEEQRITNQKLSGNLEAKQNEVNILKQCLVGLDNSLFNIGNMTHDLQKSCSLTQMEKVTVKNQHDVLLKDHELLRKKYIDLQLQWSQINKTIHFDSHDQDEKMKEKMNILYEENHQLKIQLEHYRESLEKTEQMLEKIQNSVDFEENNWKCALRSSEQDCHRLESTVKELTVEIEELRGKSSGEPSDMIASVSTNNGTVSSESKKKRKKKNKKKKKTRVSETNGN